MILPVSDKTFLPMIAEWRAYEADVAASPQKKMYAISVSHGGSEEVCVFEGFVRADSRTLRLAERIAKLLLWAYGGNILGVYGSDEVFEDLRRRYMGGERSFDSGFMSGVYEAPFEVRKLSTLPHRRAASFRVGGNLKGCRIGFDAGGSDRKVSAVVDGEVVYSEEVLWHPKTESDPSYHFREIVTALRTAASKMPRVDSVGVSSAGVYVDNKAMVASLFLKVDRSRYGAFVRDIYLNAAKEIGAPVTVANDGDVTALAGSMALGEGRVLGIAMGTSEAAGYINAEGGLNGWLSEFAFAPVDLQSGAPADEWSGDYGVGSKYFSQDAVIRLMERGGYRFRGETPAAKLAEAQRLLEEGDPLAATVFSDIGVYLGHALPLYARIYDAAHILLLGRVMSGRGGELILKRCREVLAADYPEMTAEVSVFEGERVRVGQAIAAASL